MGHRPSRAKRIRILAVIGAGILASNICAPLAHAGGPLITDNGPPGGGGGLVSVHTAAWAQATGEHATEPASVYVWPQSAKPGQAISIHVSSVTPTVTIRFRRAGLTDGLFGPSFPGIPTFDQPVCAHAEPDTDSGVWSTGCGWSVTKMFTIPTDGTWTSGLYYVEVVRENVSDTWHTCVAPFVVLGDPAAPPPNVAVVFATATSWAYEGWGGRSTYFSFFNRVQGLDRTHLASMLRPTDNGDGRGLIVYDLPWVRFLAENNRKVDYLTMEDIHNGGLPLLQRYHELVFIGHSEYWSGSERGAVEAFIAGGGNVFFPSGNICFGRIKYSADGRTLIAYKSDNSRGAAYPAPNDDTWRWNMPPINQAANSMTGVNWEVNGVGMLGAPGSAWTVRDASVRWIFAGTGLSNGDVMGGSQLTGDEVDGDSLAWSGTPGAPGSSPTVSNWSIQQGTDPTFHVFATCETRDNTGPGYSVHPMWGVAGYYQRGGQGMVVTLPQRNVGQELWPMETSYGGRLPIPCDTLLTTVVLNIMDHLALPLTSVEPRIAGRREGNQLSVAVRGPNPMRMVAAEGVALVAHSSLATSYRLDVLSVLGQRIGGMTGQLVVGENAVNWRPERAPAAGVYFWRISTDASVARGRFVVQP